MQVAITRAGLALLDELGPQLRDCHRRQLGHLSAKKLQSLVALLRECAHRTKDAAGSPPLVTFEQFEFLSLGADRNERLDHALTEFASLQAIDRT